MRWCMSHVTHSLPYQAELQSTAGVKKKQKNPTKSSSFIESIAVYANQTFYGPFF